VKLEPLSRGAYRLLKSIKAYDFQRRGWSCPGQDTLAKDLRVSERQIQRYLAELSRKSYLRIRRRPNSSSLYYFSSGKRQNVGTDPTKNVGTDVVADVGTIHLLLKHVNTTPRKPPAKEFTTMTMPEYYLTLKEQKLWRMAARWIAENNPDLGMYTADRCAPIMELLDKAGAAELPEDGPLPAITWPPAHQPVFADPIRKPVSSQRVVEYFRRMKESGE
jgi:DNA-binding transcriptional MocR family regulator